MPYYTLGLDLGVASIGWALISEYGDNFNLEAWGSRIFEQGLESDGLDAISRGKTGESIAQILDRFPFWFAGNYQKYANREQEMPFDQHFLISLIAPRLVYTSTKTNDAWADPASEFESLVQADPVWSLFGETGLETRERPLPETPLHAGRIGHHQKTGEHNMDDYDWDQYMDFADRHMKTHGGRA